MKQFEKGQYIEELWVEKGQRNCVVKESQCRHEERVLWVGFVTCYFYHVNVIVPTFFWQHLDGRGLYTFWNGLIHGYGLDSHHSILCQNSSINLSRVSKFKLISYSSYVRNISIGYTPTHLSLFVIIDVSVWTMFFVLNWFYFNEVFLYKT